MGGWSGGEAAAVRRQAGRRAANSWREGPARPVRSGARSGRSPARTAAASASAARTAPALAVAVRPAVIGVAAAGVAVIRAAKARVALARSAAALAVAGALTGMLAACSVAGGAPAPGQHVTTRASAQALSSTSGQALSSPRGPSSAMPTPSPSAVTGRPLAGQVIVIDPGHNGANWSHPNVINRLVNVITERKPCDTTGTETDAGYTEHAFNFNVAIRLATLLRKAGATVILTRTNDHGVGPCITQRAAIGNRAHADAAISIHADGGPPGGSGFDVIEPGLVPGHTNGIVGPSHRLALDIRNAYHRITHEPYANYVGHDALDVRTDLGGLNLSTVPKVFIECGNMRNAADAAKLSSPAFRQRIAVALAAGLTAFLVHPGR
jgi:N-acetylmuramoyl-L-alanine amidase